MNTPDLPIRVEATVKGNLADVTKLGGKIIDTFASACGILYSPIDKVRTAKADAEAKLIEVRTDIEVEKILQKAGERFFSQQLRQQRNVDAIVSKAIEATNAGPVSDTTCDADWVNEFVDCSKNVSDEQMQILLAKILAGEVAQPGKFSRRTMNFVKTLSRCELETFSRVCGFAWRLDPQLYFVPRDEHGVGAAVLEEPRFDDIQLCRSVGLVHDHARYDLSAGSSLTFAGERYTVAEGKTLHHIAAYPFTPMGAELASAVSYHFVESVPWCWLPRWSHALVNATNVPPSTPTLKKKQLPNMDEESLMALLQQSVEYVNFWMPDPDSKQNDLVQIMTPFRVAKIKHAADTYMSVRNEILHRKPEMQEQLPPLELSPLAGD